MVFVELTEAAQRILRQHLGLIVVLVALGMAIPLVGHLGRSDDFVAKTRFVIGATDTTDAEGAEVLADTAQGIVTSPGRVRTALEEAKVERNATDVARNHVNVSSIGTSGVLELAVSDRDPDVAATLANSLAADVVALRRSALVGRSEQQLAEVETKLISVGEMIGRVEARAEDATGAEATALGLLHANLLQQRTGLANERQRLNESISSAPEARVIDPAEAPQSSASGGLAADLAVGGLLGLILGVAGAAILEAMRPTIVGADALARALDAPVIGRLPRAPEYTTGLTDPLLPGHLRLAASGAGVAAVQLTSIGPPVDLPRLVRWLRVATAPYPLVDLANAPSGASDAPGSSGFERPTEPVFASSRNGTNSGIVVVAPEVLHQNDLTSLEHLLAMTQWPLIGIISYKRTRSERMIVTNVSETQYRFTQDAPPGSKVSAS